VDLRAHTSKGRGARGKEKGRGRKGGRDKRERKGRGEEGWGKGCVMALGVGLNIPDVLCN